MPIPPPLGPPHMGRDQSPHPELRVDSPALCMYCFHIVSCTFEQRCQIFSCYRLNFGKSSSNTRYIMISSPCGRSNPWPCPDPLHILIHGNIQNIARPPTSSFLLPSFDNLFSDMRIVPFGSTGNIGRNLRLKF